MSDDSPAEHEQPNPIVSDDDGDGFDLDDHASTSSLDSTTMKYREIHGRTFQSYSDANYWRPNDDKQNDVLDMGYHMMRLLHNDKLFFAPLHNPQRVLDVGTGTGIWAMDFADEFPSASVIGIDLSPIQPHWVPPNASFQVMDASESWTFGENTFDYIHPFFSYGAIADWPSLFRKAFNHLKPGGWIEHADFSAEIEWERSCLPTDNILSLGNKFFRDAGRITGKTSHPIENQQNATWMKDVGFIKVHVKEYDVLIGQWPTNERLKEVGVWNLEICKMGMEGYGLQLGTQILGHTFEEIQVMCAEARETLKKPLFHTFYRGSTAYAQKPAGRLTDAPRTQPAPDGEA
ncbi:S-adenosyl-L-methionine-dependent methyltransferase [Lasiosphaeria hispida]|uniref:S-adenosyl-L-methionine-dependent methyltransferase n=1 Tax=Lasiosphaeria hispida TaxID=260671 RepID=A0AAJ0HKL5_9PEZI|nr:S-adenosyl-L-methionine-dependent methyltransferase [Lasiosphaeria hispida]